MTRSKKILSWYLSIFMDFWIYYFLCLIFLSIILLHSWHSLIFVASKFNQNSHLCTSVMLSMKIICYYLLFLLQAFNHCLLSILTFLLRKVKILSTKINKTAKFNYDLCLSKLFHQLLCILHVKLVASQVDRWSLFFKTTSSLFCNLHIKSRRLQIKFIDYIFFSKLLHQLVFCKIFVVENSLLSWTYFLWYLLNLT